MCSSLLPRVVHAVNPAFAITVYKLQGPTLPKLILSVCKRPPNWSPIRVAQSPLGR